MKKDKTILKFNILAILCIIIFCIAISPITMQNDTYYTISIGEYIMQNGIDMQDHFSWHELPYTYPHWLYDVFIYLIYSGFGMAGIYASTCILSAILGVTLYGVNCKLAKNHVLSFLITIGSMFLIKDYIAARAQLVTFILFVLTIFFIEKFLETKHKRYAVGLIIIALLIANMHVAVWPFFFILFLPYIGEYLIAVVADYIIDRKLIIRWKKEKIDRLAKKPGNEDKIAKLQIQIAELNIKVEKAKAKRAEAKKNPYKIRFSKNNNAKWLIIIAIVCVLTGLLTPIGDAPYTYLSKTMAGNTTQNINEHQPTVLINSDELLSVLIILIAILTFTKTKIELRDLFMIGGLTFLMLYSRRQSTMFILIGSIIFNRLFFEMIRNYIKKDFIDEKLMKFITTIVGAFVTVALVLAASLHFVAEKEGNKYVDDSTYPVAACDYILENIDISKAKFYNDYNYGSYMLYRGIPVFIDSRADLYDPHFNTPDGHFSSGKNIFMDFINVSGIASYYDTMFDDYEMTHVITTKGSKLAMLIKNRGDDKYKELYSDEHFIIYEIHRGE